MIKFETSVASDEEVQVQPTEIYGNGDLSLRIGYRIFYLLLSQAY